MTPLVQAKGLSKAFGKKILFENADFTIHRGDHIGLIGVNGCGKTTLFKLITGQSVPDEGDIIFTRNLVVAHMEQEDDWTPTETVEAYINRSHIREVEEWEFAVLAQDLSVPPEVWSAPMSSLSGGYRSRVKLMKRELMDPDLLLLDEPTNYLDLETILIFEDFFAESKRAFLLISHDKEFLRRTTDQILEIDQRQMTSFPGNLDDYFEQKKLWEEEKQAQLSKQMNERKALLEFVNRFRAKASKAKQAQSRMKRLEKMKPIALSEGPKKVRMRIPKSLESRKLLATVEKGAIGYVPSSALVSDIQFELLKSKKVAIVGNNGRGKSTFLKTLIGNLKELGGAWSRPAECSFFHQHLKEALDLNSTVLTELEKHSHPSLGRQDILDLAGQLLFQGDDVEKPIHVLSGGEKTRVALGQVLLTKSPVVFLDEPTNHLDFYTVENLSQALKAHNGALLVVSHDRNFLATFAEVIIDFTAEKKAVVYPGSMSEYAWSKEHGILSQKTLDVPVAPQKPMKKIKTKEKKDPKGGPTEGEVYAKIQKLESDLEALLRENKDHRELATQVALIQNEIQQLEQLWETLYNQSQLS